MIGDKWRLKYDIVDPACGDHPDLLVARRDTVGTEVNHPGNSSWDLHVSLLATDDKEAVVGLKWDEVEAVK